MFGHLVSFIAHHRFTTLSACAALAVLAYVLFREERPRARRATGRPRTPKEERLPLGLLQELQRRGGPLPSPRYRK